ncbi:hypothetical protein EUBSIR_00176 [[Eubacterium] siraeum DSM 15702]|uniref:Uncharacterized protein n=1 Tax=[Eubacterium] siraeum DSM 15702 TaxID=428128 RepID=B0MK43_9FIRM|nr:hypothetical protein EUBSIR_00176 [[Eubacterium] siraeum DSM 15702]
MFDFFENIYKKAVLRVADCFGFSYSVNFQKKKKSLEKSKLFKYIFSCH